MQEKRDGPRITTAGVCIERDDRHFVVYRGTREALIAAGLAKPENFPEGRRHLSWHYPTFGENWEVRRKNGDVFCLTKLKDSRGIVGAEIAAFKLAAATQARRDAGFQRFMAHVRRAVERADSGIDAPGAGRPLGIFDFSRVCGNNSGRPRHISQPARRHVDSLERLAVATLLAGITIYFWMRKS